MDYHLQSVIKEIPLYVKDTKDFMQKLNQIEKVPEDSLLVTLDVKSLYTNISSNEGKKAVKEAYDRRLNKPFWQKVSELFSV